MAYPCCDVIETLLMRLTASVAGILLSLSKIARAHFLNLIFFLRTMKT